VPDSLKFPRILHLPWSQGASRDDLVLDSVDHLCGRPIRITEKTDGSNLTMTRNEIFSRSHNGPPTHRSFDAAKALHAQIRDEILLGFSIFGEWLWAEHSIHYDHLPGFFLIFDVRDDKRGEWLEEGEIERIADVLGLPQVPVLCRGEFTPESLRETCENLMAPGVGPSGDPMEGLVVRACGSFTDFATNVAKQVRPNHVTTDQHWLRKRIVRNSLEEK
jgi:hypothetical protein